MNEDLLARLRLSYDEPYWHATGMELIEAEPGRGRVRVRLGEGHLNGNNVVHGGVIASLIDSAAECAVRTLRQPEEMRERPHATSDLHVSYLAGARGGELFGEGRVTKMGRTLIFVEVSVTDETARLIGRGLVTMVITSRPPKPREEAE